MVVEILKRGEVVASHNTLNLIKIFFGLDGFTVRTFREAKHYLYAEGYTLRS